jgi:hypothetical protein
MIPAMISTTAENVSQPERFTKSPALLGVDKWIETGTL